jgi:hypothetical protein
MQKALDLLSHLPDTPECQRTEIELQLALGGALIAAWGHATGETGRAYARARGPCELLNDTPNLLNALWGKFVHYHVRGEQTDPIALPRNCSIWPDNKPRRASADRRAGHGGRGRSADARAPPGANAL